LFASSPLQERVRDGMDAVAAGHRALFEAAVRDTFADSLDLDAALVADHPDQNRRDHLLGHESSRAVVAVEPHSAKEDEIRTVIGKRARAQEQLQTHLRPEARIAKWLWVASGKVHFAITERARRRLDQHGIEFVGRSAGRKHLPLGMG
jgi:hypothetical protein